MGILRWVERPRKQDLSEVLLSCKQPYVKFRHSSIKEQVAVINPVLRGHYNYYGMAGNSKSLIKFYYKIEKYWKKILSSRCMRGLTLSIDDAQVLLETSWQEWQTKFGKALNNEMKWIPPHLPKIPYREMSQK